MSGLPSFNEMDIATHSNRDDLWVAIHGKGAYTPSRTFAVIDF